LLSLFAHFGKKPQPQHLELFVPDILCPEFLQLNKDKLKPMQPLIAVFEVYYGIMVIIILTLGQIVLIDQIESVYRFQAFEFNPFVTLYKVIN